MKAVVMLLIAYMMYTVNEAHMAYSLDPLAPGFLFFESLLGTILIIMLLTLITHVFRRKK